MSSDAGDQLANPTPVLIIDEPIFIANGKNSDHYYDSYYSRMLYDQYRQILSGWANDTQQPYLDYWNAIPPSEFTIRLCISLQRAKRNLHRFLQTLSLDYFVRSREIFD